MTWQKFASIVIPILIAVLGVGYTALAGRISTCENDTRSIHTQVINNGKGIAKILGHLGIEE
jgi:hypothetical protein